jgi:uncharacterized membrane protein
MARGFTSARIAPIVAGIAGVAWFGAELGPQISVGYDTDNPAEGLAFIAANPTAWPLAGVALGIAAVALVATVLAMRARLVTGQAAPRTDGIEDERRVAADTVTVVGLFAAAMLFGMAAVRMSGGPVRYVQGLDQAWGEAAYLVTQFVGIQALVTGGFVLLDLWLVGFAWLGLRRGVVPRVVALLAVLPASRLLGVLGPFGIEFEGGWFLLILAMPAAFVWIALLGVAVRRPVAMSTGDILRPSLAARDEGGGHLGEASA